MPTYFNKSLLDDARYIRYINTSEFNDVVRRRQLVVDSISTECLRVRLRRKILAH